MIFMSLSAQALSRLSEYQSREESATGEGRGPDGEIHQHVIRNHFIGSQIIA